MSIARFDDASLDSTARTDDEDDDSDEDGFTLDLSIMSKADLCTLRDSICKHLKDRHGITS